MVKMVKMCTTYLNALLGSKKGQGMVEYGLILGLVAVVVIAALTLMGSNISTMFSAVKDKIPTAVP